MPSKPSKIDRRMRLVTCRSLRRASTIRLRSVRPSLLDPRFRGDAWIVPGEDGLMSLYLENSCLVRLQLLSFDVAALNVALQQMRWCRTCQRNTR